MFRYVSVKKMFIALLAAIVVMLGIWIFQGPYVEEGQAAAIKKALLEQVDTTDGTTPVEGHRLLQITVRGDSMEVWGAFKTGTCKKNGNEPAEINTSELFLAKMVFAKENEEWVLKEFIRPEDTSFRSAEMKETFPWQVRFAAQFAGMFESDIDRQMQESAAV